MVTFVPVTVCCVVVGSEAPDGKEDAMRAGVGAGLIVR
jgi:hypothetical protein